MKDDISSLLHMSLCLSASSSMRQFRECLIEVVKSRLVFLHGRPPHSAAVYRQHALDMFLARGPDWMVRRSMVTLFLPGDWRNEEEVEYYFHMPGIDDQLPEEDLKPVIAAGVARALANRQFTTYPRNRWVGFDLSIGQLGILEVAHGLLRHTFIKFCSSYAQPQRAAAGAPGGGALAIEGEGDDEDFDAPADAAAGEPNPAVGAAQAGQQAASDFAKQNEKHRRVALGYALTKPLGRIMLLRKIFDPFRALLNSLIHISSDTWERRQAADEAKYIMGQGGQGRKFRVTIAASQELENKFATGMRDLGRPQEWEHLPAKHMHRRMRGLAFRMMSRGLCTVQYFLTLPHDIFPLKLFLALDEPDFLSTSRDTPECEMDLFTRDFISKFDLEVGPSIAALRFIASMAFLDIVQIEQRHAALRKRIKVMAPTNKPTASDLAAYWIFRQYRLRGQGGGDRAKKVKSKFAKRPVGQPVQKQKACHLKKKVGGGQWRAYIRMRVRGSGKAAGFRTLAHEYRALSPAEKAQLAGIGRVASMAARRGSAAGTSFGPTTKQLRRAALRHARQQHALRRLQQASIGAVPLVGQIDRDLAVSGGSVSDAMALAKLARQEARSANRQLRLQHEAAGQAINEFQAGIGAHWLADLKTDMPNIC